MGKVNIHGLSYNLFPLFFALVIVLVDLYVNEFARWDVLDAGD